MTYSIQKLTGTYAETLEAIGLGSLLNELGYSGVVNDKGGEFTVSVSPANGSQPPVTRVSPGFPYIWERKKEAARPKQDWVLDYEVEREKREVAKKASKKSGSKLEEQGIETAFEPAPELATAVMLSSMRQGWNSDRNLANWLHRNPGEVMVWTRFMIGESESAPATTPKFSNTQILNPIAGKGVHAAKTKSKLAASLPLQFIDPFTEWMKLRGLWAAMLTYRNGKDFKFIVIEPADIPYRHIKTIRDTLAQLPLWGGVKLDINATLRCLRLLIDNSDVVQAADGIPLRRRNPRQVIRGLRQAYFKSLGTAAALMNDALLPLPEWFPLETTADAGTYFSLIDEIVDKGGCLNSLDEDHSDDCRILQQYREWLMTGQLEDLLTFHHAFAQHLMQRYSSGKWVRPFGTENLTALLTRAYKEHRLTEIIENAGFQSVARAIRNATIYALSLPNMKREVRFGLAQEWKQKIKSGPDAFAVALTQFVQAYNWETVHRLKGVGHSVTTEELDSLIALLDKRAELTGSLLLAYGFARAPKIEVATPDTGNIEQ